MTRLNDRIDDEKKTKKLSEAENGEKRTEKYP